MERPVSLNERGLTLIELLVSLVILSAVSLAMVQTYMLAMRTNVQNAVRDEAVNFVDGRLNELRGLPFTETATAAELLATAGTAEANFARQFRAGTVTYLPRRAVADIDTNHKQVTVSVSWIFSRQTYTHAVTTIVRKQL